MTDEKKRTMPSEQGNTELAQRLSWLRLRAGLTQTDVAETVGVSRQHISNMETGITSPTVRVLGDYLHACGTGLAEFFYGPLPTDQTPRQREYHRKLQALLENSGQSPVVIEILNLFTMSMQYSQTAAVQPIRVQARRATALNRRKGQQRSRPEKSVGIVA
jgi:transcriptional regulator with XRE-family HTH domain